MHTANGTNRVRQISVAVAETLVDCLSLLLLRHCTCPHVVVDTGVNPAGDAGDTSPPIFWLVGMSMGISPSIFLRTFG